MIPLLLHNSFHSHYASLKKEIDWGVEDGVAELIVISSWWKQDIHTDFKAYTAFKRGLILLVIFSTIAILGRQRNWKMPLFICVRIVLFILFTSNIRPKLLARVPLPPLPPPMPHPTFKTPPQLPLLLHLIQWHLLWLMLIKLLSALSPPLHHLLFLLLHFLFPIKNSELASISIVWPIRCQCTFHIQSTKSLPALRLILWLVCWPIKLLITAMAKYFCTIF